MHITQMVIYLEFPNILCLVGKRVGRMESLKMGGNVKQREKSDNLFNCLGGGMESWKDKWLYMYEIILLSFLSTI